MIRLLGPGELTPVAKRQLEKLCETYGPAQEAAAGPLGRGWSYQAVRRQRGEETTYAVHEVHHDDGDKVGMTVNPVAAEGETLDELVKDLLMMLNDCRRWPVLDYGAENEDQSGTAP